MATDYQSIEDFAVPQAIDETSSLQNNPLGLIVRARDGGSTQLGVGEFIYLPGVASTVVGSVARIIESATGTPALPGYATELFAAATTVGAMGVSMSANVASQYGWYQISGLAKVHVTSAAVSSTMILEGEPVYPSTTAGAVTDNATGTAQNVFITSASFSKIPTAVPASPTFEAADGTSLLGAAVTTTTTTAVTVAASHAMTPPFVLKVDDEQMYAYVAASTNVFTVVRGVNGSTAATHLISTAYTRDVIDVTTDPQHLYIRINRPVSQGTAI